MLKKNYKELINEEEIHVFRINDIVSDCNYCKSYEFNKVPLMKYMLNYCIRFSCFRIMATLLRSGSFGSKTF